MTVINKQKARLSVAAFFFLTGLCFATWGTRVAAIQEKLGLSEAELGLQLLCIPIGSLVSLPIAGWLVTRSGSKPVLLLAAVLYAVLLFCIGQANNVWMLGFILFCFGFTGNLGNISVNTQAVSVEALYEKPIMSSFHAIWSLGGLIAAITGLVLDGLKFSLQLHFLYVSLFALLVTALAFRNVLPYTKTAGKPQPIFVMPDKSLWKLGLIAFCCMICEGAMYEWTSVYYVKVVMAPASLVIIGYLGYTAATTTGRFTGDWLIHRVGGRNILLASGILAAAGLVLAVIVPTTIFAMAGFLLVGLGVSWLFRWCTAKRGVQNYEPGHGAGRCKYCRVPGIPVRTSHHRFHRPGNRPPYFIPVHRADGFHDHFHGHPQTGRRRRQLNLIIFAPCQKHRIFRKAPCC